MSVCTFSPQSRELPKKRKKNKPVSLSRMVCWRYCRQRACDVGPRQIIIYTFVSDMLSRGLRSFVDICIQSYKP
jgi:hypothetical protein